MAGPQKRGLMSRQVERAQLSLVGGAVDRAPGQPGRPRHGVADNDLVARLALWLADVAAEASLATLQTADPVATVARPAKRP